MPDTHFLRLRWYNITVITPPQTAAALQRAFKQPDRDFSRLKEDNAMAQQVNSEEFSKVVRAGTVLVDFYSDTCAPCRRMMPVLSELESEQSGRFTAVKVNVASDGELADRYGVDAVPTFVLFKNGEEKARIIGAVPKEELASMINAD